VAILNRGPSHNIEDYIRQFRAFAGIEPTRIDAVAAFYHRADRRVVKRETHAVLDLPATGAALADAGFVSTRIPGPPSMPPSWRRPPMRWASGSAHRSPGTRSEGSWPRSSPAP
jgi:hypothetical protein